MDARTELGVWRVLSLLVAFGSGIAALMLGGYGGLLLTFLGLFASFMAGMVFEKGERGWAWAAAALNGLALLMASSAMSSGG